MTDEPLWTPSHDRVAAANLTGFGARLGASNFAELHEISTQQPDTFWSAVWDDSGVIGDRGARALDRNDGTMRGARFFPDARLNFAENLMRSSNEDIAIVSTDETSQTRTMTRARLHTLVGQIVEAMRRERVQPGDRVAAWMANIPETVAIMLAASSIGAVFSSTSPDFGVAGVVDRFGQIEPVLLFAVDGYHYGGKRHECLNRLREVSSQLATVRRVVVVRNLNEGALPENAVEFNDWLGADPAVGAPTARPTFVPLPFDHPLAILYSSGTTGPPKCIVHRAGGLLLKHLAEQRLQCDVRPGDRVFYFTTCGWMMWNWLVSALASDATIVLFDGSPFHRSPNALFDLVDEHKITHFGISAKFIDSLRNESVAPNTTHDLGSIRALCSTGSPLVAEGFDYIYDHIAVQPDRDLHVASISGGTDLCGCLLMGDPTRPVFRGEIQGPALGIASAVWDDDALPVVSGETGELVCTVAFPSMPVGFWNDADGSKYRSAYFDRYAEHGADVWAHGDFVAETEHGGYVIYGRSDATLNPGGVRIGTAELYRQVEALDEVTEALAIGQPWGGDVRIVLFVRLAIPKPLSDELQAKIRGWVRSQCSPRHVPAVIVAVDDLPRTRSGKLAELAVADVVAGRVVRNRESLANPEALDGFINRVELQT